MLKGHRSWNAKESGLNPRQKLNLLNGTAKCMQAMDDAVLLFRTLGTHECPYQKDGWNRSTSYSPTLCLYDGVSEPPLASALAKLRSCDVLLRLRTISSSAPETSDLRFVQCHRQLCDIASVHLALVESSLPSYFLAEDPQLSHVWTKLNPSPPPTPSPPFIPSPPRSPSPPA